MPTRRSGDHVPWRHPEDRRRSVGRRWYEAHGPRLALDPSYEPPPRPAPEGFAWRLVCADCGAVRPPSATSLGCAVCADRPHPPTES
jgi:hypothetical protein